MARLHSAADLILASHVGVIMGYVPPSDLLLRHVTAGSTASMSVSRHGLGTIIRELRRDLQVGYSPEEAARSPTSTFLSLALTPPHPNYHWQPLQAKSAELWEASHSHPSRSPIVAPRLRDRQFLLCVRLR